MTHFPVTTVLPFLQFQAMGDCSVWSSESGLFCDLSGCTGVCLSKQSVDIGGDSRYWLLRMKSLWTFEEKSLCTFMLSFLPGKDEGKKTPGRMGNISNVRRNWHSVFQRGCTKVPPTGSSSCSASSATLTITSASDLASWAPRSGPWRLWSAFHCINEVERLFTCFLPSIYFFFGEVSFWNLYSWNVVT